MTVRNPSLRSVESGKPKIPHDHLPGCMRSRAGEESLARISYGEVPSTDRHGSVSNWT